MAQFLKLFIHVQSLINKVKILTCCLVPHTIVSLVSGAFSQALTVTLQQSWWVWPPFLCGDALQ